MNINRAEMIELLEKLIEELKQGKGIKWKAQTTTLESAYPVEDYSAATVRGRDRKRC